MKTLVRCVLLAAGFGLVAAVSPASAQIYEELRFKTTFPFMVGRATLPAGTYSVSPAFDGNGALLEIRGDRHAALFFGENAACRAWIPRRAQCSSIVTAITMSSPRSGMLRIARVPT